MRFAIIFLLAALLAGSSSVTGQSHRVWNEWREDPKKYGDTFDWSRRLPGQFLQVLEQSGDSYSVLGIHHDWIRDSDIETLMSLLDSPTPCAYVVSVNSSRWPHGRSTVGREAAYLLEGYRLHYYPPQLSSADFEPNKEELRHWYKIWSTRK